MNWIKFEDKIPEIGINILIASPITEWVTMCRLDDTDSDHLVINLENGNWFRLEKSSYTHWMPLPEPPKG